MAKQFIEREAALAFPFANGRYDREHANEHFIFGCESYKEWLEQLPAADVVARDCYDRLLAENDELRKERLVRHGRWEKMTGMMPPESHGHYWCSECLWHGKYNVREIDYRYCPDCGARMDKDGDGDV